MQMFLEVGGFSAVSYTSHIYPCSIMHFYVLTITVSDEWLSKVPRAIYEWIMVNY